MRGPGTVFAAEDADPTEALALDPATGEAVQDGSSDVRRLGEYKGTILSIDGQTLRATGEQSWELSLSDNGWDADELRAVPGADPGEDVIALDAGDGVGPVLDRETGELLDDDARGVAQDANTGAVVTLSTQGLTVIDDTGKNELPVSVPESVELEAAVGGLIYLREGGTLRVHNAATGSLARGYPADGSGTVAVPVTFTTEGLGTLRAGDRTLLATDRVVEDSEDS